MRLLPVPQQSGGRRALRTRALPFNLSHYPRAMVARGLLIARFRKEMLQSTT